MLSEQLKDPQLSSKELVRRIVELTDEISQATIQQWKKVGLPPTLGSQSEARA